MPSAKIPAPSDVTRTRRALLRDAMHENGSAFIVEPKRPRPIEKGDVDYVMTLNDGFDGYTLNGMVAALIVEA